MTASVHPVRDDPVEDVRTAAPSPPSPVRSREEKLVRLLERASASSRFTFGERWLFGLGGALAVAGFVLIIVAWVGASRTVLVAGQMPYLLSGGLIGLGFIFIGGFLYFGRWMAVLVRESRERGSEDRDDLAAIRDGIEDLNRSLTTVLGTLLPTGATRATGEVPVIDLDAPGRGTSAQNGTRTPPGKRRSPAPSRDLVATANGTMAHRPDCLTVAHRDHLRAVGPEEGLKACGMCHPYDD